MLGRRLNISRKPSLLSRYSETLGELMMRHKSELAMMAARIESEAASRAKSAFLGTMSHELRTPLNAIIGFSDLIRNAQDDDGKALERMVDFAGQIGEAGRHLLEIVSDILDISKIESGTVQLNLDDYAIDELVEGSVSMVSERIRAKDQQLELRLAPDMPELTVDARRVKQILINLLSNANKFTPEGGRILVTARRAKNGGATIVVVDNGVGMTADQIQIAMTPFGQIQSHLSRTQEGAGLGLPIALGLAREHGGSLELDSEPGVGTSAILTLPPDKREGAKPATTGGGERRTRRPRTQS